MVRRLEASPKAEPRPLPERTLELLERSSEERAAFARVARRNGSLVRGNRFRRELRFRCARRRRAGVFGPRGGSASNGTGMPRALPLRVG